METEMTLRYALRSFFRNGGWASNGELARMYNASANNVRATITALRRDEKMPISKVLKTSNPNEAYYQLVPEYVIPRKGRPAHRFCVRT